MDSNLAKALVELQADLPHIAKSETAVVPTKTGGKYTYTYAGLAQISDEIRSRLAKCGLAFIARPTLNEQREFVLAYELVHESGESTGGEFPLTKGAPQDVGSQITYARRYTLCAVTGLAPDDDDDAAAATKATTRKKAEPRPTVNDDGVSLINGEQQAKMGALFRKLGLTDQKQKLAYAVEAIGRDINSATELTRVEADKVIGKLTRWEQQGQPPQAALIPAEAGA